VVASITKRTGLLRQKEVGSFLWSVGKGGGRRPQWLETSVRWRIGELPRIPLLGTWVNNASRAVPLPLHRRRAESPGLRGKAALALSD
jgi:hypothetical protein